MPASSPERSATSPSSATAGREDVARRGAALPGGRDQPARHGRGRHDRLGLGRGRAAARDVDLRCRSPTRVAGRQDQPDRHARRPELPGRRAAARCASSRARSFVVSGVMGVEVGTRARSGSARTSSASRASSSSTCSTASAPTSSARSSSLKAAFGPHVRRRAHPDRLRARAERDRRRPPHVRVHEPRRRRGRAPRSRSRTRWPSSRQEYREKLLDEVVENRRGADGALPRGRGDLARGVVARRSRTAARAARSSRSPAASRRRTSARTRCSTCSSRASLAGEEGRARGRGDRREPIETARCSPSSSRRSPTRSPGGSTSSACYQGTVTADTTLVNARAPRQGADGHAARAAGQGARARRGVRRGRHRRRRQAQGDARPATCSPTRTSRSEVPAIGFPEPVMSFAITPKAKGDEEKVATAIRRLAEEDPTLDLRRDQQTGEEILSGMSQMHVEVASSGCKRRFGVEVELQPPRVPYLETIRRESRGARALQEADRRPRPVRRLPHRARAARRRRGYEFVDKIVGGVIPQGFGPPSTRASRRRCSTASSPAPGAGRARDGSSTARTTPSTRRRWRSRSPARWR